MIRTLAIVAALALAAGSASAQKLDAKGQCRDAQGKPAAASVCRTPVSTTTGAATAQKASVTTAPHHCNTGKPCGDMCIPNYWTCKAK